MLPKIVKLKGIALDLLFPQSCIGCGKEGSLLCPACCNRLPRLTLPLCPRCGKPQPSGRLCPGCVSRQWRIDGIRAPFRFEGVIRQAIHQLKYSNLRVLAVPLAKLLCDYFTVSPVPGEVLVPVPLHPQRLKERGYNQSSLLARELGHLIQLPVIEDGVIRQSSTLSQTKTMTVEERWHNVAHAFTGRNPKLQGKPVLLIDDVATSGATLESCAQALKAAGAVSVWGLVLAREV